MRGEAAAAATLLLPLLVLAPVLPLSQLALVSSSSDAPHSCAAGMLSS